MVPAETETRVPSPEVVPATMTNQCQDRTAGSLSARPTRLVAPRPAPIASMTNSRRKPSALGEYGDGRPKLRLELLPRPNEARGVGFVARMMQTRRLLLTSR